MMNTHFGEDVSFDGLDASFFLVGLINEFNNRFQAAGDALIEEISWKQCFLLNCITFFKEPPTIRQLSDLVGSSHQNVKQLLIKLKNSGYIHILPDEKDKRKQRIVLTKQAVAFREKYAMESTAFMQRLFSDISQEELKTTIQVITKLDSKLKNIMGE